MKRIIKNEFQEHKIFNSKNMEISQLSGNAQKMHPITLNWIDNSKSTNPLCITKPSFDKEGVTLYKDYKCTNQYNKYNNYLYTPPIGISSENLIIIYDVESIENLQSFINDNITKMNILTLNRIVNSWIRVNFDTIKTYNNFLEKIYKKILEQYYSLSNFEELNKKINLDKEIKDFIDYWFSKNNNIGFKFNLLLELQNYLEKVKK
jgi:hypothetical protein